MQSIDTLLVTPIILANNEMQVSFNTPHNPAFYEKATARSMLEPF